MLKRTLLAIAFSIYALNVPELLHAMEGHAHGHEHGDAHGHAHDGEPAAPDAADLSHLHCLSCVNGVQVLEHAPDLAPVTGRLHPHFVPPQFVPAQPSASIFHPPA